MKNPKSKKREFKKVEDMTYEELLEEAYWGVNYILPIAEKMAEISKSILKRYAPKQNDK